MQEHKVAHETTPIIAAWLRILEFITTQTQKTIERPSRIFTIAGNVLLRVSTPARRFAEHYVPLKWIPARWRRTILFTRGVQLLDANRPQEAWESFRECLRSSNENYHYLVAAVCLAQGLGRFRESIDLFTRANELRQQRAERLRFASTKFRVLTNFWATNLGHTATLDYVIKLGILEGRSPQDTILYVPDRSPVANPFLLEQFRPYLKLARHDTDLPCPKEALEYLRFDYLGPRQADGMTVYFWELAAKTYRRWHEEGRAPLLALPPETEERGRQALAAAGIPRDAWFVGLHVRERGFNQSHGQLHNVLNARIDDYLPAIAEVARRGGWVIRMGDPSMVKLPPLPKTLDYCHSALRSDWMDVFIAAKCRFFIGTSSGPAYVPPLYGASSVLTNWWPPGQRPWHAGDIFIPKTYRRLSDRRHLSLEETLVEPLGWCNSVKYLEQNHGVVVEDNDPQDILAAVIEMCELTDHKSTYDDADVRLRARVNEIFESNGVYGMGQFARDFLRRRERFVF